MELERVDKSRIASPTDPHCVIKVGLAQQVKYHPNLFTKVFPSVADVLQFLYSIDIF